MPAQRGERAGVCNEKRRSSQEDERSRCGMGADQAADHAGSGGNARQSRYEAHPARSSDTRIRSRFEQERMEWTVRTLAEHGRRDRHVKRQRSVKYQRKR